MHLQAHKDALEYWSLLMFYYKWNVTGILQRCQPHHSKECFKKLELLLMSTVNRVQTLAIFLAVARIQYCQLGLIITHTHTKITAQKKRILGSTHFVVLA